MKKEINDFSAAARHLEREVERRFKGKPLKRHILSVAGFARRLAESAAAGDRLPEKAYVAGLAHDLYKKHSEKQLREFLREDSVAVDEYSWILGGGLLHAPAAAHYLRTRCSITDATVLAAVYYHTTGRAGASALDKALFCADYLDPTRENHARESGVAELREKALTDLDGVYQEVLSRKLIYTIIRGRPLHPFGVQAWNDLCRSDSGGSGHLSKIKR